MPERIISGKEIFALRLIDQHSNKVLADNPGILDDIAGGELSTEEIAIKYEVARKYGVTPEIAKSIIKGIGQREFSAEERAKIFEPRVRESRQRGGYTTLAAGTGVHGLTESQRRDASHKAGSVAGPQSYKERFGLFGLDKETLRKRIASSMRGKETSWFNPNNVRDGKTEAEYALFLVSQPDYQLHKGDVVSPDYTKIMGAVNAIFGRNRSRAAVKGFFENEKMRNR
ncbi:MAG: hypothetical protein COU35_02795 [Candidatus Magasanikbacteria bacterium CG10_big_fil_rev_8_21_14_0_10_47_10]|uniref:Uncharacterized protein n=1 Tax=Candidatus Magasanikbacteria bacterium CG10_big_fil_rev_8_21_14_0_10_47_10 TaxID=1974652 RepID=A0A2H0TQE8_9BACT|nr:MAG: hypothetical protein COU35_02795 [Candidatus Magasanikbacteria bacterium CG10_big_fil_rev_8_21_14_0_10_47_10]